MPILTIIRGLPGSGKTTLAKIIRRKNLTTPADHFEADMFFERSGEYVYDQNLLPRAHKWCQDKTKAAMSLGRDVVVSNTFTRLWEMAPYMDLATEHGYKLNIIECKGTFQNIHGVPEAVISKMKDRWENI
jgi:predicted kinase